MPSYRRLPMTGGRHLVTVNPADRRSSLPTNPINNLRPTIRRARTVTPSNIDAWVVLPNHMHAISTLPEADADDPHRWRTIQDLFSSRLNQRAAYNPGAM